MSSIRKLAGETLWYGLSSILGRLINYLLVPFYTSKGILQPEEYGAVGELLSYVAFLNIIYTFGLETTYFRYANKLDESKVYSQALSFIIVLGGLLSALLALNATQLVNYMGYTGKEEYIYLLAALMFIDALWAIPFARLRFLHKARYFALTKVGSILLNVGFNILFLWILPQGGTLPSLLGAHDKVGYVFLANLLANALLFFPLLPYLKDFRFRIERPLMRQLIAYAAPLVATGLAGQVNGLADRWFIKYYMPEGLYPQSNQYILGVYNACVKFSVFLLLYIQAFRYASEPFYFSKVKDRNAPEVFARVLDWFTAIGCLAVLAVSFNIDWLKWLLIRNEAYHQALGIVPVLLMANLLLGIYFNLGVWYKLTDRTIYGTYFTLLGAVVTVLANLWLVPRIGYMGSAYATLAAYGIMLLACYWLGQRHYPIPYRVGYLVSCLLGTALALWAADTFFYLEGWQSIVWKNLLLIPLGLGFYWGLQSGASRDLPSS
ncbi:MAG: polysaccharide biosynthesis protein [Thermonema sp.]|uniref:oligosaccharide flippase family protein n=1 Tax=Thermonema TaxID=28194 RepID=UPI000689BC9B|nr:MULTISPECIES: oligosaccharide flippase family protein [Thermonema]GIV39848.1 MAG: polysaccharide biosynthesis protein [Thermonema sp.]